MELLAEGQQLEEELQLIVDYTQGGSLARFRMNKKRHTGCDVDVCMTIMHVYPETRKKNVSHVFSLLILLLCHCLSFFFSYHFPSFHCRKLSSFVWRGCRLMKSYGRSPRVTDLLTEREGIEEEEEAAIIQTAVPMPRHPLHTPLAPTTVAGVDAEATATALDMVETL